MDTQVHHILIHAINTQCFMELIYLARVNRMRAAVIYCIGKTEPSMRYIDGYEKVIGLLSSSVCFHPSSRAKNMQAAAMVRSHTEIFLCN